MPTELEYLEEALEEAEAAGRWYAERSASAAVGFSVELDIAESAIAEFPNAWPSFDHGTRRYLLRRYPFSVIYRVEPGIDGPCFRPVLVALRKDATSAPEFDPSKAAILDSLSKALREPAVVSANFIGCFEWVGEKNVGGNSARLSSFGKSKATTRLILREVTDIQSVIIPRK